LPVPAGLGESCLALGAREPAFAGRWAPLVGDAALSLIARTSAIDRLRVGFFATFDSTRVTPCFFASRLMAACNAVRVPKTWKTRGAVTLHFFATAATETAARPSFFASATPAFRNCALRSSLVYVCFAIVSYLVWLNEPGPLANAASPPLVLMKSRHAACATSRFDPV